MGVGMGEDFDPWVQPVLVPDLKFHGCWCEFLFQPAGDPPPDPKSSSFFILHKNDYDIIVVILNK